MVLFSQPVKYVGVGCGEGESAKRKTPGILRRAFKKGYTSPLDFESSIFNKKRARDVYNITGSDRSNCRILCVF